MNDFLGCARSTHPSHIHAPTHRRCMSRVLSLCTANRVFQLGGGFASYSQSTFSSFSAPTSKSPGPTATWLEAIGAQRQESHQKKAAEALELPPAGKPSTGEEDEEVACELKGLKLFVKRGAREFNPPIGGHAKVLISRQKETKRIRELPVHRAISDAYAALYSV